MSVWEEHQQRNVREQKANELQALPSFWLLSLANTILKSILFYEVAFMGRPESTRQNLDELKDYSMDTEYIALWEHRARVSSF